MSKELNEAEKKIKEALGILQELGFPRQQINPRSALTLLALLGLKPGDSWAEAGNPLMGITPMMEFFAQYYEKRYAPNTRETVRRQSVHQFIQAALVVSNPDAPSRPTNSPKAVYQIEENALKLLRAFGQSSWNRKKTQYLNSVKTLNQQYARERKMRRIPVQIEKERQIQLSPGLHNELVRKIIEDFCPLFTPGAKVVYVGDTQKKWAYCDRETFHEVGLDFEEHGKMPDVVVYYLCKKWLVLIEAVTSHGPVNPKRRLELKELFAGTSAGIVYVTAFPKKKTMMKYLDEISWETEVWIAEAPTHLIHFNGERFLGPYDN